jgi:23S rRNA (uracil1939-C5)-methyltransferase
MTGIREGDRLELSVEKPVYRGLGLARHEGCVVFVRKTLPGERVRARVFEVGRGYVRAEPEAVLEASPARRPAPCPHAASCGGCSYQEAGYGEQLRIKELILRESLARAHVAWEAPIPVVASPETGWRTRAELHLAWQAGAPEIGFFEEGTHRVVDVGECLQLSSSANRALAALRAALRERAPLTERVTGIELGESPDGGQLVCCLHAGLSVQQAVGLAALAAQVPGLSGLLAIPAGAARTPSPLLLFGSPFLEASPAGFALRAHQQSFFQSNRFLTGPLAAAVLARVPPVGPVLELYAGVGLLTLPLLARNGELSAVEESPLAAADARANAERAGLELSIHAGSVENLLHRLVARPGEHVVLDPPRTGASRLAIRGIASRRPASITYVSCDPPTLGRDLHLLEQSGYRLAGLEAFDMFPDTFHLESVALLLPL